jgi:hypothetical protein
MPDMADRVGIPRPGRGGDAARVSNGDSIKTRPMLSEERLVSRSKAVHLGARDLGNLDSMKDAVNLVQHHNADTLRSGRGFPGYPDVPNRASEDGTSMVSPRSNCATRLSPREGSRQARSLRRPGPLAAVDTQRPTSDVDQKTARRQWQVLRGKVVEMRRLALTLAGALLAIRPAPHPPVQRQST